MSDRTGLLRRQDKQAARLVMRDNLVHCIVVSVIGAAFIWPVMNLSSVVSASHDLLLGLFRVLRWTGAEEALGRAGDLLVRLRELTSFGSDSTAGVISMVYSSVQSSGGIARAVLTALAHLFFHQNVSSSIIVGATFLVSVAAFFFLRFPLRISSQRFYLETRIYPRTPLSRLVFVFRSHRTCAIALAGVYKIVWLCLWSLTLVMGPVKYYSYLMYDYILAENPSASPREALRLSRAMMKGNKMRAFLLDLSFVPWYLLGFITFGLVIYFYANPYRSLSFAEFYVRVREAAITENCPDVEICNDRYLVEPAPATTADDGNIVEEYPHPNPSHWLNHIDYRRTYSLVNLGLFFFCFSFIGWVYESTLSLVYVGHLVNKGTLYGPWIPIYGTGGVAVLLFLKPIRKRPVLTFFAAMAVCGVIEYLSATIIYDVSGLEYWSYAGYFFNIQGRVCLEGLLVFGMGCTAVIYFLAPLLDTWLDRIPLWLRHWIVIVLATAFLTDAGFTAFHPRTGAGLTS